MRHVTQRDAAPIGRVPKKQRRRPPLLAVLVTLSAILVVVTVVATITGPQRAAPAHDRPRAAALPDDTNSEPGAADPSATAGIASGRARFGVFVGTDPAAADRFQKWVGRPVQDVVDFSTRATWDDISNPSFVLQQWKGTRRRLIYGVPMLPDSLDAQKQAAMRAGAAGAYDARFTALAQRLVDGGHQNAVLRIGWEFNLTSWAWGIKDSATFIAFFRHVVAAMRSVPGQKFDIDWNPNNGFNPYDAVRYYPGNAYVDSVGVDAYDVDRHRYPFPKNCDAICRETRQKAAWDEVVYGGDRGLSFWSFFASKHGKPLALPEWSMWNRYDGTGGGDDPYFLDQMHFFIASPANNVAFAAYFNRNSPDGKHNLISGFPLGSRRFRSLFGREAA